MMKYSTLWATVCILVLLSAFRPGHFNDHKTLEIGAEAPDFSLLGVDGKTYSLSSFNKAKVLVVVFTCNHCPTAQAYEDRIIKLTSDYATKNVAVVAIMPNDPKSLRLDELDFSDLGDSFEEMKIRAQERHFNFPYLYDGITEVASQAYGPVATPHVFVFDQDRKLRYQGRIDDTESPFKTPTQTDARNAIDDLLNNREVRVKTTKVFGCSIKWSEKRSQVDQANKKWADEPVRIELIGSDSLRHLINNPSQKLYLFNFWSMSSKSSTDQFHEFVIIHRMYRDRDFEFISVCTDGPSRKADALAFLHIQQAANANYLLDGASPDSAHQALNGLWQGTLPYTLLVEPGGKIANDYHGLIDPGELKRTIVNNHLLGRYP
jgi:thiol-disulfide isomerase/thioredoxin